MLHVIADPGSIDRPLGSPPGARRAAIPSLTGIRGVAALIVVAYHLPIGKMYGFDHDIPIIDQGFLGVDLFFILSGFILMHVHAEQFATIRTQTLKEFFILRFFRVYPLHFIVLLCILGFVISYPAFVQWFRAQPRDGTGLPFSLAGFLQTLTLTNRIGLPELGEWNGPTWSLSSEIVGYVLFPLFAFLLMKTRSVRACYAVAAGCLMLFCIVMATRGHIGMPRMLLCFTAGTALGRANRLHVGDRKKFEAIAIGSALACLVLMYFQTYSYLCVCLFATLILSLSLSPSIVGRVLSSRLALYYGRISFSLYLTHFIIFNALFWAIGDVLVDQRFPTLYLVGLLGGATAIATLSTHVLERPFHRFGHRLAKRYASASVG